MARTVAIHTGSSDSDLQRPLSQLLGLVFDLVQRHTGHPGRVSRLSCTVLLVAHSMHALQAHIFSVGYVVLPVVVGERRYELVQLSPPWRRYTPSRDIGVPTIGLPSGTVPSMSTSTVGFPRRAMAGLTRATHDKWPRTAG